MRRLLSAVSWLLLMLGAAPAAYAQDPQVAAGQAFFERYQHLERNFDPGLATLYDDDAVIWVKRLYSNGVTRQLKLPGELYRQALVQSMDEAAAHGDFNEYSDARYVSRGQAVEIRAWRYNPWRRYRSPYMALIRPGADGQWRIVEERFETRVAYPATE